MTINLRNPSHTALAVCAALNLSPHPEGGHYRELWRDGSDAGQRGAATSILFLLAAGERSRWHRVDAAELWHWHAGAPLLLEASGDAGGHTMRLGPDLAAGDALQGVIPRLAWQQATSLGAWSLAGCVVAPAFDFAGFEMAPPGWSPGC